MFHLLSFNVRLGLRCWNTWGQQLWKDRLFFDIVDKCWPMCESFLRRCHAQGKRVLAPGLADLQFISCLS